MGRVVSATEARAHFGDLMCRVVEEREPVIVERAGKPQVVVLPMEAYARLQQGEPAPAEWRSLLDDALATVQAQLGDRPLPPSEDVIREMR